MQKVKYFYDKNTKSLTIEVNGSFDFSVRKGFRESYMNTDGDANKIIVDLRNSEYMDSSALGMLLILKDVFSNAAIRIVNVNDYIKSVLEICNFHKLFDIK